MANQHDSRYKNTGQRSGQSAGRSSGQVHRMQRSSAKALPWLKPADGDIDYPFLLAVMLLLAFGLVMLFSAGSARAFSIFGDSLWYFKEQTQGIVLGLIAMFVLSRFDYHQLGRFSFWLMLICLGLLILVIIPGVGTTRNGATRWLFGFQPSEVAKFAIILFYSFSLSKNREKLSSFTHGFLPYLGLLAIFMVLLLLEPHMSCALLMGFTVILLLFVAGAKWSHFLLIGAPAITVVAAAIMLEPYRRARVLSFLDPFSDIQGAGWQIVQSLYAIGSGGVFGTGLGQSRQKYLSLPEPQNDFIFSVLAEELGLLGAILMIVLFIFLIVRGAKIALKAPDLFGSLLVIGIVGIVAIQTVLNIAVVTSSMPVTGVPLPFFSFGSTALSITLAEMGIVLNVSRQIKHPI